MTITELAQHLGTTVRALRYYEEVDLLIPGRTSGNARIYGLRLQGRARMIVELRRAGVAVQDIRPLLVENAGPVGADVIRLLEYRLKEVEHQAIEIRHVLASARSGGMALRDAS